MPKLSWKQPAFMEDERKNAKGWAKNQQEAKHT
jgi:hypothetical protein